MNAKPRLGFLGVGWIGRKRLESVAQAGCAAIVGIADPAAESRTLAHIAAPDAKLCASLADLLALDLDGLVIATPNALHTLQAKAALTHGVAVFCQKPLGRNAAEVQQILNTARQADRLLGIDLSYRHTRALQAVRHWVATGKLGTVFAADLVFHNAYGPDKPWFSDRQLSGGGCVLDLGVHLVDAALWILGGKVARLTSHLRHAGQPLGPRPTEVEDYAVARFELDSSAVVNLACSWRLHAGQEARIELAFYGTGGGACFRNVNGSFTDFRAEQLTGTHREILVDPPDDWGGGAILSWVQALTLSPAYDPAIEQHKAVATVLDAIYDHAGR